METVLTVAALLLALALVQAVVGILFFPPRPVLASFFFQALFVFIAVVVAVGFAFEHPLTLSWLLVGVYALLFLLGFRCWRRDRRGVDDG